MMDFLRKSKNFLLDLLFPIECLGCGEEGEWICQKCYNLLPLVDINECPRCHGFSLQGQTCAGCRRGYALGGVVAASDYGNYLTKRLIVNLKYSYVKDLSKIIAETIVKQMRHYGLFIEENWLLVPVPLHRRRFLERGFNQAELICRHIQESTGLGAGLVLARQHWRPPQASLKGDDRLENIKNVFVCKDKTIKIKKALLVDDVFTTGATLNECARVLKEAGAREVWGLVAARG